MEKQQDIDFSKPPTGHHPGEGAEGARAQRQGPDHMRDELNPTPSGISKENKGQERRERERRQNWPPASQ